jgi:Protein of unknown function (DUF3307)
MTWSTVLVALLVSHVVGDVLLQTDWQARHKVRGFGDRVARRALIRHVALYTLAFIPALIWIGDDTSAPRAIEVAALVAVPHLLVDEGHLVRAWLRDVKGAPQPALGLMIAVDQSFHLLCLFGAALIAVA